MIQAGDEFEWHGVHIRVTRVKNTEWATIHCTITRVEHKPWDPDHPAINIQEWDKLQYFPGGNPPTQHGTWIKQEGSS